MKRDEKLRMLERMRVQSAALSTTHSSSFSCPVVPASTLLFVKYYCSQLLLRHVVTFSKGGGGGRTHQLLRSSLDNSPEWIGRKKEGKKGKYKEKETKEWKKKERTKNTKKKQMKEEKRKKERKKGGTCCLLLLFLLLLLGADLVIRPPASSPWFVRSFVRLS